MLNKAVTRTFDLGGEMRKPVGKFYSNVVSILCFSTEV